MSNTNTLYNQTEVDELKRCKIEFVNTLLNSNISYNLCSEVSSHLNDFINKIIVDVSQ